MKFACLTVFAIIATLVLPSFAQTGDASCQPANCAAQCPSGCSSDQICALGTMSSCGVCPDSVCISKALLGLPTTSNSSSTSSSSGPLIGGIVGAVLGVSLLIALAFAGRRYTQRKKMLALRTVFSSTSSAAQSSRSTHTSISMSDSGMKAIRHNLSGLNSVSYLPSNRAHLPSYLSPIDTSSPFADTIATSDDPFSDIHSQFSDNRQSFDSAVTQFTPTKTNYATQITRAKPQVMRIDTLRRNNSSRSNMSKTSEISKTSEVSKTSETSETSETSKTSEVSKTNETTKTSETTKKPAEDPFDDSHEDQSSSNSPSASRPAINSIQSAPGDGEITIFWCDQNK